MSYHYITNRDSPNYTPAAQAPGAFGQARIIEGITIHWWGDPNQNPQFDSVVNYLCRPNGNSSAHFVATGTNRQVACIVSPGDVAWHAGSAWGNARTIGIELDPRARDEDYDVAAELIADIRSAYGDVPIYWHSYFLATQCPGAWNPERLDALSYTKYSHATDWGKGGNKNQAAPAPAPTPTPAPAPSAPSVTYYKLVIDGKQVAAYSTDVNAYKGYVEHGRKGSITYNGKAVTQDLIAKFTTPSPTTQTPDGNPLPDTGKPVVEKDGYVELEKRVTVLEGIVKAITDWLASFKK